MWPEAPRIRWRREGLRPHRPELRELLTIPRAVGAAGGGTGGAGGQGQEVTAFSSYRRSDRSSTCGLPPADPVCGHVHENFLRNLLPALTIGDDGARTPWHTLRAAARNISASPRLRVPVYTMAVPAGPPPGAAWINSPLCPRARASRPHRADRMAALSKCRRTRMCRCPTPT